MNLAVLSLPLFAGLFHGPTDPPSCTPVSLAFTPATVGPFEPGTLVGTGAPGTLALVGIDLAPGPTNIPGIGVVHLGLSPALAIFAAVTDGAGRFEHVVTPDCKAYDFAFYAHALTLDPSGETCLSNPATLYVQRLGQSCEPPTCIAASSITSNFNGTAIAAGKTIWFNSIVKVTGLPAGGGTVGFRNGHIDFAANGVNYSLPVPNATITVSSGFLGAATFHDGLNTFQTGVPDSYSGNIFLSGLPFLVPTNLPGGIGPVTWSGEFVTSAPGVGFQWKWAAAVYTNFTSDLNAIGIKPVDGSSVVSAYMNGHHAGTPENYAVPGNCVGGARGGGSSNFTGSYSGTASASCQ